MGLTRSLTMVVAVTLSGCGNGTKKGDTVNTTAPTVDDAGVATGDSKSAELPKTTFEPKLPSGVEPFAPAEFVTFVGLSHGDSKPDASALAAARPAGSTREKMDKMMGSDGFEYPGHFALSWQSEDEKIDYISVKSATALDYLEKQGHGDARLKTLWGISPEGALGVLGEASEIIERSHSFTFRFDFANGGRTGTLSLDFSRLGETVTCSMVSVHWTH